MNEYEIVYKYLNACAGAAHPQIEFLEAELDAPEDYIRSKHTRDYHKFQKEILPDGRIVLSYDTGGVTYIYEFTKL